MSTTRIQLYPRESNGFGSTGATGPTGPASGGGGGGSGSTGPTGPSGASGVAGTVGATGPAGIAGPTGPSGVAGTVGATGPSGPSGVAGVAGPTGPSGVAGTVGATGPSGPTGPSSAGTFTPTNPSIWLGAPPTTVEEAINRLGMILYGRTANQGLLPTVTPATNVSLNLSASGTTAGASDVFVASYSLDGVVQWSACVSGTSPETSRASAICPVSGNVALLLEGTTITTPGASVFNSDGSLFTVLPAATSTDIIIVVYNSLGFGQWVARMTGGGTRTAVEILYDPSGNLIATGFYTSATTVLNANGTTFTTLAAAGSDDTFLVKYNSAGAVQWATRAASTSQDTGRGLGIDSSGNCYISLQVGNTTIFNSNGTTFQTITGAGNNDVAVVKFDSTGMGVWTTRITSSGDEQPRCLTVDPAGNVYLTGLVTPVTTIFNSDGSTFQTLGPAGGGNDCYVVKWNTSGFGAWATRIAGTLGEFGVDIAVDSTGAVIVTGLLASFAAVLYNSDGSIFKTVSTSVAVDTFLVKYNASGFGEWFLNFNDGSTSGTFSCSVDTSNNIYINSAGTTGVIKNSDGTVFSTFLGSVLVKFNPSGFGVWYTTVGNIGTMSIISVSGDRVCIPFSANGVNPLILKSAGL